MKFFNSLTGDLKGYFIKLAKLQMRK